MNLPAVVKTLLQPVPAPPSGPVPEGVYLGWGTKGPVLAAPDEHALVLGPPRSGKTARLLAVSALRHPGPAVVTSTKADVIGLTGAARADRGQVWVWDPSAKLGLAEHAKPLRWSPVPGCDDWDEAVARAYALASAARPAVGSSDRHWLERAQALLAPLLHAGALAGKDLAAVLAWLHRRELYEPLGVLAEHGAELAGDILEGISQTDGRELSGIFSTADGVLSAYRSQAALAAATSPNFDPAAFAASGDTLYICAPSSAQALYAPLVVALLDQVRAAVYRRGPTRPHMLFALDELAQIAPLPDLASTLAEGGSQGLAVLACLQDLSQARARWGAAAEGFLTLFTHKVLLPGIADMATLKAVSALAGEVDVRVQSVTVGGGFLDRQTSKTWSLRRQPRLPVDAVAQGAPGTALLLSGTQLYRVSTPALWG